MKKKKKMFISVFTSNLRKLNALMILRSYRKQIIVFLLNKKKGRSSVSIIKREIKKNHIKKCKKKVKGYLP